METLKSILANLSVDDILDAVVDELSSRDTFYAMSVLIDSETGLTRTLLHGPREVCRILATETLSQIHTQNGNSDDSEDKD